MSYIQCWCGLMRRWAYNLHFYEHIHTCIYL
ncbi:hypothetical protein CPL00134L_CDS0074 [Escherichia phage Phagiculus]